MRLDTLTLFAVIGSLGKGVHDTINFLVLDHDTAVIRSCLQVS
jgi:hypothetical protein